MFNSEEFLKTRAAGDQRFYKQVRGMGWLGLRVLPLCFSVFKHFFRMSVFQDVDILLSLIAFLKGFFLHGSFFFWYWGFNQEMLDH